MYREIVGKCPKCGAPAWLTSPSASLAFCTKNPDHRPQIQVEPRPDITPWLIIGFVALFCVVGIFCK